MSSGMYVGSTFSFDPDEAKDRMPDKNPFCKNCLARENSHRPNNQCPVLTRQTTFERGGLVVYWMLDGSGPFFTDDANNIRVELMASRVRKVLMSNGLRMHFATEATPGFDFTYEEMGLILSLLAKAYSQADMAPDKALSKELIGNGVNGLTADEIGGLLAKLLSYPLPKE